ncbi:MAG: hypothetical protein KDG50_09225 [Chromatiales bacterium]|nr:hypothetical protein [Chromatiales bacterium]
MTKQDDRTARQVRDEQPQRQCYTPPAVTRHPLEQVVRGIGGSAVDTSNNIRIGI